MEEFLQSTGLGLSLGAFGISARLQLDPRSDPLPALHALLDLPLRLEEGGGYRALIVLDEFQDITKVKDMDALLRSHIQFQGEVASFVFAGSEPGLMRELFEIAGGRSTGRPCRCGSSGSPTPTSPRTSPPGSARPGAAWGRRSTRCSRRRRGIRSGRCCSHTGSGSRSRRRGRRRSPTGRAAHAAALEELRPEFDANWRRLTTNEQKALRAVVSGSGSPYRRQMLEQLDVAKSSVRAALSQLLAQALVEQRDEEYALVDPLFAEWIAGLARAACARARRARREFSR